MYPGFNRPRRPLTEPLGLGSAEWDQVTAPSLVRDMARESRSFPPRADGMKQAVQPFAESDQSLQYTPTGNPYWSNDHHNWIKIPRGNHFRASHYDDPTMPHRLNAVQYHH